MRVNRVCGCSGGLRRYFSASCFQKVTIIIPISVHTSSNKSVNDLYNPNTFYFKICGNSYSNRFLPAGLRS